MPFVVDGAEVRLEGHCAIEEAEDLHRALIAIERPGFDLAGVGHLHTAILQILIASRGAIVRPPADPLLRACLASLEPPPISAAGVRVS